VCGVPVVTTVQGAIAIRLFDRETTGPVEVFTINLGFTARSRTASPASVTSEPTCTASPRTAAWSSR
jgi:hypothetical protein